MTEDRGPKTDEVQTIVQLLEAGAEKHTAVTAPAGVPLTFGALRAHVANTVAALNAPSVQQRLKEIGSDLVAPERMSPEYLGKFVAAEIDRWARVIKASGIQLE